MGDRPVAICGCLIQTLITLLDALRDPTWVSVTLEPDHVLEKIDIFWQYKDRTKAVQVKSSETPFEDADVKGWARGLEASKGADEYELILVGTPSRPTVSMARRLGKVAVPTPKNADLTNLKQQAAYLLERFMSAEALTTGVDYREMLANALTGKLETLAAKAHFLSHAELVALLKTWIAESPNVTRTSASASTRLQSDVPSPPLNFVDRPAELQALKNVVLGAKQPVAIVGLCGMGGIGKSVLAAHLAQKRRFAKHFLMAFSGWSSGRRQI